MQSRIYVVISETEPTRLVEATSQAQAIRHVVANKYRAEVATTKDVAHGMQAGLTVESALTRTPDFAPSQDPKQTQTEQQTTN